MSITIIPGATRVIKLTPNNSFIPSTIEDTDQLFNLSLLSDSKFSSWLEIANNAGKIGIVDDVSSSEISRYIDSNYNASTPTGSIWFKNDAQENGYFYLQTGAGLSKSNASTVFSSLYTSCHGFEISSGNPIDRCGRYNGVATDLTYGQSGIVGKGVGFNGSTSRVNLGDISEIKGQSRFSLTMLMKQTVLDVISAYYNKSSNSIYSYPDGNLTGSVDQATAIASFDYSTVITADTFFLIDIVFDGTQTGNANRYKIFVNGQPVVLSFTGDMPAVTLSDTFVFEYGTTGIAFDGVLDEARFGPTAKSANEVLWRYNQWFDQANYWTPTIQPIITSVNYINSGRWQITGTGFKPETTNPSGTIGGVAYTIETATDTEIIIQQGAYTPTETQTLVLTNSDTESYNFSIIVPYIAPYRSDFIGMPPIENALPPGNKLLDTQYGNPNGDVVDNSAGAQSVTENTINPSGSSGGGCLNMYSKPSWLCS